MQIRQIKKKSLLLFCHYFMSSFLLFLSFIQNAPRDDSLVRKRPRHDVSNTQHDNYYEY